MNRSKDNRALHRAFLGYWLAHAESFKERGLAGRRLRCVKAGRVSARRQGVLGWPNLTKAWAGNRRKGEATKALKRSKELTRELERRGQMLACDTQVLRRI